MDCKGFAEWDPPLHEEIWKDEIGNCEQSL